MKKLMILTGLLLITNVMCSQTKNDLIKQIDNYRYEKIFNKPYDVDKSKLFETMNIVAASEFPKLLRESESRGFCEYYYETEFTRQTLTMEIINNKKPFRLLISLKKETRTHDFYTNSWSEWRSSNGINQTYLYKLQYEIYVMLFGYVELPDDLRNKIEAFNALQTKEKKKLIFGIDY